MWGEHSDIPRFQRHLIEACITWLLTKMVCPLLEPFGGKPRIWKNQLHSITSITLPESNIPLKIYCIPKWHFQTIDFQGQTISFREGQSRCFPTWNLTHSPIPRLPGQTAHHHRWHEDCCSSPSAHLAICHLRIFSKQKPPVARKPHNNYCSQLNPPVILICFTC